MKQKSVLIIAALIAALLVVALLVYAFKQGPEYFLAVLSLLLTAVVSPVINFLSNSKTKQ
ncbi:hypothetical protein [Deinococcus cellulosilyticus]|uniref:Uncharacterized protein n=1 Tax=Deinococcus cellulosilyticus (strain DSM 18568 / NBRC 106333 / KACC 11606 / 5516J-15) TaxID=1223518 RepID=A0A511NBC8_DEIC1|nr:hypothetical protein [Deinococcus cellulosilyticus]GEM50130.1 hypothetical protein DC3_57650 [Deinococcus cellulosilyticus NBRC 106333 = KACC 11606]